MTITNEKNGTQLTLSVEGRVDTVTAPQLEQTLTDSLEGITELVFEFSKVDYISSAGLRVLLAAQKKMNPVGSMVVRGANEDMKEIFQVTGFADILTIE